MRIRHFIVVLSATFMLALVGVPEIHAQEPGSATVAEDPGTRTEWGFLGYSYSTALGGGHGFNIGLPILKWGSVRQR